MDYIFASILRLLAVRLVLVSYDIACQWFINLLKRMQNDWTKDMKPNRSDIILQPAIPKLHEPAHNQKNHEVYSFNYIPGGGLTDGECPERVWAPHNAIANATKTQGPGSRQDTLDDHFGFWNWLKYISMGSTLLRRYKNAIAQRNIQKEGHRGLTEDLKKKSPGLVEKWEQMCIEWEKDPFPKKNSNPYSLKDAGLSEAKVKKMLAQSEAEFMANGGTMHHKTTASVFISMGLDLEDTQRRIQRLAKGTSTTMTTRQEGTLTEQRNALITRIRAWELLLPIYIPGLLQYQADHPDPDARVLRPPSNSANVATRVARHAEDTKIWLPSTIPESHRSKICIAGLGKIESQLREAQMTDSLNSLRQILKLKTRMILFKHKNIRGQRGGTRSTAVIDRVHERARFSAAKYRDARTSYMALVGPGDWEKTYCELHDGDIRGYQDPNRLRPREGRRGTLDDDQIAAGMTSAPQEEGEFVLFGEDRTRRDGSGQTRRTLSWIWTNGGIAEAAGDDDSDDILRVEWAKSRARSLRAEEEVLLLKEEMRRVLAYLEWRSEWWRSHQKAIPDASTTLLEGISAYALSQASLQDSLAAHFKKLWMGSLDTGEGVDVDEAIDDNNDGEEEDEDEDANDEEDGDAEEEEEEFIANEEGVEEALHLDEDLD
ncbi:hypothetical protein JR316_0012595 [Psilocybe cubensis]|nr:hypothetical protein JR316_0012595 [Psilocybe cubensis]KAH9475484.1 hypothetical protein JR316_0012595 [Psilocybe cubensis]